MDTRRKTTRGFPVTSPPYEVRQFRKSRQVMVDPLEPGTVIRFSSDRMVSERGGDAKALYATCFTMERLEGESWVTCSRRLGQGELAKRICIVTEGDADDPTIFDEFNQWDKPLVILVPRDEPR